MNPHIHNPSCSGVHPHPPQHQNPRYSPYLVPRPPSRPQVQYPIPQQGTVPSPVNYSTPQVQYPMLQQQQRLQPHQFPQLPAQYELQYPYPYSNQGQLPYPHPGLQYPMLMKPGPPTVMPGQNPWMPGPMGLPNPMVPSPSGAHAQQQTPQYLEFRRYQQHKLFMAQRHQQQQQMMMHMQMQHMMRQQGLQNGPLPYPWMPTVTPNSLVPTTVPQQKPTVPFPLFAPPTFGLSMPSSSTGSSTSSSATVTPTTVDLTEDTDNEEEKEEEKEKEEKTEEDKTTVISLTVDEEKKILENDKEDDFAVEDLYAYLFNDEDSKLEI